MALRAVRDSLEGIPESEAALYKEAPAGDLAGKYILDVKESEGYSLGTVASLNKALERGRSEIAEFKARLEGFGDLTPEDAKSAVEKLKEFAKLDPEEMASKKVAEFRQQAEAQLEEANKKHAVAVSALQKKIDTQDRELFAKAIKSDAIAAIQRHNPKNSVPLILPHMLSAARGKLMPDGTHSYVIVDAGGTERLSDPVAGTPMSYDDLVEELCEQEDLLPAFAGHGISGAGSENSLNPFPNISGVPSETDFNKAGAEDQKLIIRQQIARATASRRG